MKAITKKFAKHPNVVLIVMMVIIGLTIKFGGPKLMAAITPDQPEKISITLKDKMGNDVFDLVLHKDEHDKDKGTLLLTDQQGNVYQFAFHEERMKELVRVDEKGNLAITLHSL